MSRVAILIQRVAAVGYAVRLKDGAPVLAPARSECVMPTPLLKALKDNRDAVVAYLSTCCVCGRDVSDDEDRERLADPLYCGFFGGREVKVDGEVLHPEEPRCPFKR
jgi:hypothetical protein